MFANSLHRNRRGGRQFSALAILVSSIALLILGTATDASAGSKPGGITPVGAVPGKSGTTFTRGVKGRGLGAAVPTKQVNVVRIKRKLTATLPASVDLSTYAVPVGHQGSVGSCVAWTIDYAMLGLYSRRENRPGQPFNPMYTYSQTHLDNSATGGGSHPKDALYIAQTQGNDTMAHYSRSTNDFTSQPNASERANAANWRISGYQTLFSNTTATGFGSAGAVSIQTALANGKPVAIALPVRPGFDNMVNSATTFDDDITGTSRGNHEVLAVGYDQYGVWIQNSWGTGWGHNGYGRISWRVVSNDVYQAHTISGFATASIPTGDTTAPVMGAVGQQFLTNGAVSSSTTPVQFSWTASDANGVSAYEVWVKTDAGAFVKDANVPAGATSVRYDLAIGRSYQLAVRARDAAGNLSAYSYSSALTPGVADDTTFSVGSPWTRYSLADTFGGTYTATSQAGAWLQYTASSRDLAVIGPKFATAGRATLYCDGVSYGLVDAYSAPTLGRQVLAWCHFAQAGQHTIKIVVEGTSNRPWFGVDAFAALS